MPNHAERVRVVIDEEVDNSNGASVVVRCTSELRKIITFENNQNRDIEWLVLGLYDEANDGFPVAAFTQVQGADPTAITVTDPWPFFLIEATADSDGGTGPAKCVLVAQG